MPYPHQPPPIDYEIGPSRAWYRIGALTPPGIALLAAILLNLGVSIDMFALIALVIAPLTGIGILIVLIVLHSIRAHNRSRRQRLHAQHLWYEAYRQGDPALMYPRPPVLPPTKEIRPRRVWAVIGALLPMTLVPAIDMIDFSTEAPLFLLIFLTLMISTTLISGTTIARTEYRGRVVKEHMIREMEQARGRGRVQP